MREPSRPATAFWLAAAVAAGAVLSGAFRIVRPFIVGERRDGGFAVATGQVVRPAGDTLAFGGRPVDLVV